MRTSRESMRVPSPATNPSGASVRPSHAPGIIPSHGVTGLSSSTFALDRESAEPGPYRATLSRRAEGITFPQI
ncbi:hypothetical protein K2X85_01090 [bacterium]|nr:hypothetical protein [bacterium]